MTIEQNKPTKEPHTKVKTKDMGKIKKFFTSVLCLSLVTVGSMQGFNFFFATEPPVLLTSTISYGQLGTTLEGSGTASSAEIQSTSPNSSGEIQAVYVSAGEIIQEGQLLYIQDDSEIDEAILILEDKIETHYYSIEEYYEVIDGYHDVISDYNDSISDYLEDIADYELDILDYQLDIANYQKDILSVYEEIENLTLIAPFTGKITDISVNIGDSVTSSFAISSLSNQTELSVDLYFSYIYEHEISIGDAASISIPELMLSLEGTVTDIKKVEYITKEGTKCFLVEITIPNLGSLSTGLQVSATIGDIFPVESGTLKNKQEIAITSPISGLVEDIFVSNYQNVFVGEKLFLIDSSSYEDEIEKINDSILDTEKKIADVRKNIENIQKTITNVKKNITSTQSAISKQMDKIADEQEDISDIYIEIAELEEERADFMVFSEISGKIITVNVEEGKSPNMAQSAVMIYNLDTMVFTANIDELDVEHVYIGMPVSVSYSTSGNTQNYVGEISAISYEANNENEVAYFPVTILVDSMGELSSGVSVSYKISVGDADEGYLVPIDALKTYDNGTCIYIEGNSTSEIIAEDVPEGYYVLPITVLSSDSQNALISSDVGELSEGMTVFSRYQATAPSNGDVTSVVAESGEMDMDAMMAMRESMMAGGNSAKSATRGG